MNKQQAIDKVKRIIKGNTEILYGGQFDAEKYTNVNIESLEQDLTDFIEKYWKS